MKFIHISNIYIGANPDPDKYWSSERANDIKDTFSNVIDKCREDNIDLLLISGNLFNHQPTNDDLYFVNDLFKSIPNTNVFIVAGSSDHLSQNSPIFNFKFSLNVHYFFNNIGEKYIIDNRIVIHGFSYYSIEEPSPIIDNIIIDNDDKIHILIAYGGDTRHVPIDFDKLSKSNFSYIALGLSHQFKCIIDNVAYYSGSPEPINQNDIGDHGIIIGEINDKTKKASSIQFLKMSKSSYIPINVKVSSNTTEDEVVSLVTREVLRLGNNNMFKIDIQGMRDPDIEFSIDMFNKKIRISSFNDASAPKYDFVKLSAEHPQDMIGAFIRKMTITNIEQSDIEKNALYLGTHALIKSMEKENI